MAQRIRKPKEVNEKQTPTTFLMRIPIAGLYNYLHAHDKREKHFWATVLIIAAAVTLYYFIPCVLTFMKFQTVVEVRHVTEPSIPFPSIYIGLANALNATYIDQMAEQLMQPLAMDTRMKRLTAWFARKNINISAQELSRRAVTYSSFMPIREPWFGKDEPPIYDEVIYRWITAYGKKWIGLSNLYDQIAYRCDMLFRHCESDNEPFSCCENSQIFMTGSYVWFKPKARSISHANKKGGLPMEGVSKLTLRTQFYPWAVLTPELGSGGLCIEMEDTSPTLFAAARTIPSGTKAIVKIKGKRRRLMNGCINSFQYDSKKHGQQHSEIQRYWKEMAMNGNYSPSKCLTALLLEQMYSYCGCVPHYDTMKPNETSICTPAHIYICFTLAFNSEWYQANGSSHVATKEIFKRLKAEEKTEKCLPLCDTWYYDAEITFTSLNESENVIRNELVITLDPEYRLESDVLKIDLISFYATLGDSLGLCLGVSAVSFVQMAVWGTAAWLLAKKRRRTAPAAERALAVAGMVIKHKVRASWRPALSSICHSKIPPGSHSEQL